MIEIRPYRSRILLICFLTAGRSLLLRLYLTSSLKTLRLDVAGILIVVGFVPPRHLCTSPEWRQGEPHGGRR
jgi:hypothetical protein